MFFQIVFPLLSRLINVSFYPLLLRIVRFLTNSILVPNLPSPLSFSISCDYNFVCLCVFRVEHLCLKHLFYLVTLLIFLAIAGGKVLTKFMRFVPITKEIVNKRSNRFLRTQFFFLTSSSRWRGFKSMLSGCVGFVALSWWLCFSVLFWNISFDSSLPLCWMILILIVKSAKIHQLQGRTTLNWNFKITL